MSTRPSDDHFQDACRKQAFELAKERIWKATVMNRDTQAESGDRRVIFSQPLSPDFQSALYPDLVRPGKEESNNPCNFIKPVRAELGPRAGSPCRSPATKKGRCRLHGGARGSGGPSGERNGQYRHGERTKTAIAEQQKFSALLKMLRAGLA
jgi:hypothetical protein